MTTNEATELVMPYAKQHKTRILQDVVKQAKEFKILGWENNLYYQWMRFSSRQVSDKACITCHNPKRVPKIMPILEVKQCKD